MVRSKNFFLVLQEKHSNHPIHNSAHSLDSTFSRVKTSLREKNTKMPIQSPQWTDFLSCPICFNEFNDAVRKPISLGCGHTACKQCLMKLHQKKCPFDQTPINTDLESLPVNVALLQLVAPSTPSSSSPSTASKRDDNTPAVPLLLIPPEHVQHYHSASKCIEELALYLKPLSSAASAVGGGGNGSSLLSRPMQRKLVTLINCQLVEEEGKSRAMRAARSLGERTVTELILQ